MQQLTMKYGSRGVAILNWNVGKEFVAINISTTKRDLPHWVKKADVVKHLLGDNTFSTGAEVEKYIIDKLLGGKLNDFDQCLIHDILSDVGKYLIIPMWQVFVSKRTECVITGLSANGSELGDPFFTLEEASEFRQKQADIIGV